MIDQYPPANGVLTSLIWRKTAAGGETSLSGYDNASQALSYTPGQEQVYLNGILLVRGSDYTATNGTSITSLTALAVDDFVQINCYNNFSVASVPAASITGEVTNSQITSLATTKLTGTITNAQLAGSIANDKLTNSSITINGSAVALGGSATIAGGSAQDSAPSSPTEGQLWLDTNGTLATTEFVEKSVLTTTGDLLYASSANTPARIGIGSTSQVLTVSGGAPVWATPAVASSGMTLIGATTFSASAAVNVNDVFSATYQNYMMITDFVGSANVDLNLRYRVSAADNTTSNYNAQRAFYFGASVSGDRSANQTKHTLYTSTTTGSFIQFTFFSPFETAKTGNLFNGVFYAGASLEGASGFNQFNATTSFTGFSLFPNSGTLTGTLRVYGLANS